jgi:hypothetical protein
VLLRKPGVATEPFMHDTLPRYNPRRSSTDTII